MYVLLCSIMNLQSTVHWSCSMPFFWWCSERMLANWTIHMQICFMSSELRYCKTSSHWVQSNANSLERELSCGNSYDLVRSPRNLLNLTMYWVYRGIYYWEECVAAMFPSTHQARIDKVCPWIRKTNTIDYAPLSARTSWVHVHTPRLGAARTTPHKLIW